MKKGFAVCLALLCLLVFSSISDAAYRGLGALRALRAPGLARSLGLGRGGAVGALGGRGLGARGFGARGAGLGGFGGGLGNSFILEELLGGVGGIGGVNPAFLGANFSPFAGASAGCSGLGASFGANFGGLGVASGGTILVPAFNPFAVNSFLGNGLIENIIINHGLGRSGFNRGFAGQGSRRGGLGRR